MSTSNLMNETKAFKPLPTYAKWAHHIIFNTLQQIMVYLIEKLNKKLVILTFGQFDQFIFSNFKYKCNE
jgi:hypothetical protein